MERLELDEEQVETQRALMLAQYQRSGERHTPANDPLREVLSLHSPLKLYDDVLTRQGELYRVIAAAPSWDRVTVFGMGPFGPTVTQIAIRDIVDRAPFDESEEPSEVWPEQEPAPPDEALPPLPAVAVTFDIAALRLEVIKQVDVTSTALIRAGFEFEGVIFSMSNEAQIRYTNMQMDADVLPYPLPINSKDDSTFLVLRDAAHTISFCRGAKQHVMSVVASGTLQKMIVRGLTTVADLTAYRDPRAAALTPPLETEPDEAEAAAAAPESSEPLLAL